MTGDQWYNLLRLAMFLLLIAFLFFGLYKLVTSEDRKTKKDDDKD